MDWNKRKYLRMSKRTKPLLKRFCKKCDKKFAPSTIFEKLCIDCYKKSIEDRTESQRRKRWMI